MKGRELLALACAALVLAGCQSTSDATSRLAGALDRMDALTARLEMNATAEARGSSALGGGFSQKIHAIGELVPPDRLHLLLDGAGRVQEMIVIGRTMWIDGGDGLRMADKVALGPLTRPQAPLEFVRGPGRPEFVGFGMSRGVITYRVRIPLDAKELQQRLRSDQAVDPDTVGAVGVEIGLFDGLIHRQTFEVTEPADPFSGTGLQTVRTTYTIEYWAHGSPLEVREPK